MKKTNKIPTLIMEIRFDKFWRIYPQKIGKKPARKSFFRIAPDDGLLETMIAAIHTAMQTPQWRKSSGKYIPMPATWLNQERWNDEHPVAVPHLSDAGMMTLDAAKRILGKGAENEI